MTALESGTQRPPAVRVGPRLALARLVLVADSSATAGRPLLAVVAEAVAGGARAVWLREKHAQPEQRQRLARGLAELLAEVGGVLVASPGPGQELASGLQLGAADPVPNAPLVGRSCHSRAELGRAAAEGCRWATLSPIFPSFSKPGYGPALGPSALEGAPLPTWALGGVDATNAALCLESGAAGVAVMSAVLGAKDPAQAVVGLLEAVVAGLGEVGGALG